MTTSSKGHRRARLGCIVVVLSLLATSSGRAQDVPAEAIPANAAAQAPAEAAPKYRYWTTNWSFQDVDVQQLVDRLAAIGLTLPIEAAGDVSLQFRVSIPLTGLNQPKAYRFEGRLSSNRLRLGQLLLADFRTLVRYADGVLHLESLQTGWQPLPQDVAQPLQAVGEVAGSVRGSARADLVPRGELVANLQLEKTDIGPLVQLLQQFGVLNTESRLQGTLTGHADLRAKIDELQQPLKWQLEARLESPNLRIDQLPALAFDSGPITQQDERFSMPSLQVEYVSDPAVSLRGGFTYQASGRRPFELQLTGNDLPTEQIAAMVQRTQALVRQPAAITQADVPPVQGKLDIRLAASGELQPLDWNVVGRVASPDLLVLGVDLGLLEHELRFDPTSLRLRPLAQAAVEPGTGPARQRLGTIAADYRLLDTRLELSSLQAQVFGGQIQGSATIIREGGDPAAEHHVDVAWSDIRLPIPLPAVGLVGVLSAETTATMDWRVPAGRWRQPRAHRGTIDLELRQIQIGEVDIGHASVELSADGSSIEASGRGELFGGTFSVSTDSQLDAQSSWSDVLNDAWRADLRIETAQLSTLSRILRDGPKSRITGQLSAVVAVHQLGPAAGAAVDRFPVVRLQADPDQPEAEATPGSTLATGRGEASGSLRYAAQIQLQNVVVQDRILTPRLRVDLRGDGQSVWLDRIRGNYASGQLSGSGSWSFRSGRRHLSLRASSIDVPTALAPFWSDAPRYVDGYASVTATLTGGDSYRLRGAIQWHGGRLIEIPVDAGHSGFHALLSRNLQSWQADLDSVQLRTGRGRWTGNVHLASAAARRGFTMDSRWQARRVDFTDLFPEQRRSSALGDTVAEGELILGGRSITSVADLQGRFDVALDGTEARAVPGLPETQNYLSALPLSSVRFDEGRMRGVIGGGAISLTEFWLIDPQLRVVADGKIRLADGRMDVDAVLNTGDFAAQNLLLQRLANVTTAGALPISVLIQANTLLSNRTLLVHVNGPVGNPRVQLKTVETLRAHVVDFFLLQARRAAAVAVLGAALPE